MFIFYKHQFYGTGSKEIIKEARLLTGYVEGVFIYYAKLYLYFIHCNSFNCISDDK